MGSMGAMCVCMCVCVTGGAMSVFLLDGLSHLSAERNCAVAREGACQWWPPSHGPALQPNSREGFKFKAKTAKIRYTIWRHLDHIWRQL